jgi:hypothetical protein
VLCPNHMIAESGRGGLGTHFFFVKLRVRSSSGLPAACTRQVIVTGNVQCTMHNALAARTRTRALAIARNKKKTKKVTTCYLNSQQPTAKHKHQDACAPVPVRPVGHWAPIDRVLI